MELGKDKEADNINDNNNDEDNDDKDDSKNKDMDVVVPTSPKPLLPPTPKVKSSPFASMEAKLLFKKPADMTGQLELVQEGLDIIRAQTEPFAIVSVVGPTRTGKSSLLGRAFLQGENENVFEIGSGVHSYTA